jgi:hypothetical protein
VDWLFINKNVLVGESPLFQVAMSHVERNIDDEHQ